MSENEIKLRESLQLYYCQILTACLCSGKWNMSQAKKEALIAVSNWSEDKKALDAVIDEVVSNRIFA